MYAAKTGNCQNNIDLTLVWAFVRLPGATQGQDPKCSWMECVWDRCV